MDGDFGVCKEILQANANYLGSFGWQKYQCEKGLNIPIPKQKYRIELD